MYKFMNGFTLVVCGDTYMPFWNAHGKTWGAMLLSFLRSRWTFSHIHYLTKKPARRKNWIWFCGHRFWNWPWEGWVLHASTHFYDLVIALLCEQKQSSLVFLNLCICLPCSILKVAVHNSNPKHCCFAGSSSCRFSVCSQKNSISLCCTQSWLYKWETNSIPPNQHIASATRKGVI